jgi:hypothetical protein
MALPRVPTESSNEKQHRTVIATTVNELVKVRPPGDRTKVEFAAGVTPIDYSIPSHEECGEIRVARYGAKCDNSTDDTKPWTDAIAVAKIVGIEGASAGRDQGVDIVFDGKSKISSALTLPRGGNSRAYSIGIRGTSKESCGLYPTTAITGGVIKWEASTARLFGCRLRNFHVFLANASQKAVAYTLNDPTTTVFNSQPWGQEEIKELDLDLLIYGNNEFHEVLVDIEGKAKYSKIRIVADLAAGSTPTYSTIVLRANSEFIDTAGSPGDKSDAVAGDNAGINYSDVWVSAINSRGGNARCFLGRLSACNLFDMTSATGGLDANSILELYGSANNVFHRMFMEGRTENPQIYMEQCYYNTFLNVHFGSPDGSPSTGIKMVECEDNWLFNHSSATGKPAFSSNGGFLIDLDANCKRNRFLGFGGTAAFFSEVQDLGTDNYIEYVRESTGLVTQTHHRADYSIGPFTQDDVAASQTDVAMTGTRWIAPRDGRLTALVVKSTEARTAGTLTIKVFKNTNALSGQAGTEVSSSFRVVLDGTNTSTDTQLALNEYVFASGDEIYATITTSAAWTPTTADVRVWIEVQC